MKEIPMLFSTPMVQAILEERKTVTRRVIKPQPIKSEGPSIDNPAFREGDWIWSGKFSGHTIISNKKNGPTDYAKDYSPYGQPGDILWVRETWCRDLEAEGQFLYRATEPEAQDLDTGGSPWKPSIHMPKVACRLKLDVISIDVERLHEITEEDAIREGVGAGFQMNAGWPDYTQIKNGVCTVTQDSARMSYATLWDSINGKGSWDKNPWVWRIEFKKIPDANNP